MSKESSKKRFWGSGVILNKLRIIVKGGGAFEESLPKSGRTAGKAPEASALASAAQVSRSLD